MAPSQGPMDPDQEKKPHITGNPLVGQEQKGMMCLSNREDGPLDMEVSSDQKALQLVVTESLGVDIVDCIDTTDIRMSEADDPNATEYSSSFSDTVSGNEDGQMLSDAEVESRFSVGNGIDSHLFDGLDSLFLMRKKKLTTHWRSYIHPLMWRCKWLELRMKEIQSQALKYDTKLASYDQRRLLELGKCTLEGCNTKSLPFGEQSYRRKVMKRKKRKRTEDKVDIPSYMSHHNLFSYYEYKRSDADGALLDDDFGLQVVSTENNSDDLDTTHAWASHESSDDRSSLEKVLCDIETVHRRVKKLKIQLDELLTVNAGKLSSIENLSLLVQSDLPSSSAQSPTSSPRNGNTVLTGVLPQHLLEYDTQDLIMPEVAVSADGDPTPDIIESKMEMLTAADGHLKPQNGDLCDNMVDEVLINNQRAEHDLNDFEKISCMSIDKKLDAVVKEEAKETTVLPPVLDIKPEPSLQHIKPDLSQEGEDPRQPFVLKASLASDFMVPTNKRKRVQRTARSCIWKADSLFTSRSVNKSDNQ